MRWPSMRMLLAMFKVAAASSERRSSNCMVATLPSASSATSSSAHSALCFSVRGQGSRERRKVAGIRAGRIAANARREKHQNPFPSGAATPRCHGWGCRCAQQGVFELLICGVRAKPDAQQGVENSGSLNGSPCTSPLTVSTVPVPGTQSMLNSSPGKSFYG